MSRLAAEFWISEQPDDVSCGPACLQAVYRYFGDDVPIETVLVEVQQLPLGGTLAVMLAQHAIGRGYRPTIYTANLQLFDPTWFGPGAPSLIERLERQAEVKTDEKLRWASQFYIDYLRSGGEICMEEITVKFLDDLLGHQLPVICGLSSTWLYRVARERPEDASPDDVLGEPTGHFVVLTALDRRRRRVHVADPYLQDPFPGDHHYWIDADRFIASILLGIITYDAKLLILRPPGSSD